MAIAALRLQHDQGQLGIVVQEHSPAADSAPLVYESDDFRQFEGDVMDLVAQLNTILSEARAIARGREGRR